jgi:hypothetical protein|tara:strand:- start:665 stop:904 length:240 start_codon:yes stop_codon:yes gene_type:complete
MSGPIAELVGWLISIGLLAVILGGLLVSCRHKPTPADCFPWREVTGGVVFTFFLILLVHVFPFAFRVLSPLEGGPTLLS